MNVSKMAQPLQMAMKGLGEESPIRVIVRYREASPPPDRLVGKAVDVHAYRLVPCTSLQTTVEGVQALSGDPTVEQVWLDEWLHTCLDVSAPLIRAPQVWDAGRRGAGIRVGVVDTGIDADHPDFAGRVLAARSFVGGEPRDDNGHGTHVAGIIGGSGQASGGRYRGVAPEVFLYVAKVLRADGSGLMSSVMAGVEWVVDQGAQVVNLSLGGIGPCNGTDALSLLCDAVVELGVVVCVAAGNTGPGPATVGPPGCARQVITVGASDDHDRIADFSSRGPTLDGRVKPDLVFPGAGIVACRAQGSNLGKAVDARYTSASGTSMATPHASGAAALLLETSPGLTPGQVKALLQRTAVSLGLDPNAQGSGRGDVLAAHASIAGPGPVPTPPPTPPAEPGGCLTALLRALRLGGGQA
ncbi:MAG: S8 family peptidase [Chloroflexi bacterium]|nr:S8 family peptidase [Chloroflexota bacterium]